MSHIYVLMEANPTYCDYDDVSGSLQENLFMNKFPEED